MFYSCSKLVNYEYQLPLNINTFYTENVGFSSELHLQGLILKNPKLIAFSTGDEPSIVTNELTIRGIGKRIVLVIEVDKSVGIVELKNI